MLLELIIVCLRFIILLLNKTFFKILYIVFDDFFALIFFLKCSDGNSFNYIIVLNLKIFK